MNDLAFKRALQKVKKILELYSSFWLYGKILLLVLGVILGVVGNNLFYSQNSTFWWTIFLVALLPFLLLTIYDYVISKSDHSEIADQLDLIYNLKSTKSSLSRNMVVNGLYSEILNQFMSLRPREFFEEIKKIDDRKEQDGQEISNNRLDKLVQEKIELCLSPVTNKLEILFSTDSAKQFTSGLYLNKGSLLFDDDALAARIIVSRDNFNIQKLLLDNFSVVNQPEHTGKALEINQAFQSCNRNNIFIDKKLESFEQSCAIICNPLKLQRGCISQEGVLFIIYDRSAEAYPVDTESILHTFGSLITLWIELISLSIVSDAARQTLEGLSSFIASCKENTRKKRKEKNADDLKDNQS